MSKECPECGRLKATTVDDVLDTKYCPKYMLDNDPEAEEYCRQKAAERKPSFMIMNTNLPGVQNALSEAVNELIPAEVGNGRYLQILVRMKGSRPDKPHDTWYVIQIVMQSHRGVEFADRNKSRRYSMGDSFTTSVEKKDVTLHSGTNVESATPRVWTDSKGDVHFNVQNAFGKLDNIPMIIDQREYDAIKTAIEEYNKQHETDSPRRPSNYLQESR